MNATRLPILQSNDKDNRLCIQGRLFFANAAYRFDFISLHMGEKKDDCDAVTKVWVILARYY